MLFGALDTCLNQSPTSIWKIDNSRVSINRSTITFKRYCEVDNIEQNLFRINWRLSKMITTNFSITNPCQLLVKPSLNINMKKHYNHNSHSLLPPCRHSIKEAGPWEHLWQSPGPVQVHELQPVLRCFYVTRSLLLNTFKSLFWK